MKKALFVLAAGFTVLAFCAEVFAFVPASDKTSGSSSVQLAKKCAVSIKPGTITQSGNSVKVRPTRVYIRPTKAGPRK